MARILDIEGISVRYGGIEALHQVSMSVDEGEVVSLIGANGAGKSTLLKAIVGQVPLHEGSISFHDELVRTAQKHKKNLPTHLLAKRGIALVPEGRHVFADMTVEENLDMGAFLIARALMSSPKLLLLDEPGLGLAPLVVQDIFHKIGIINEQEGVTVFLVEQNARMALKASSTAYCLENGSIVLSGPSDELLVNDRVRAAYLGE